ncbi:sugar transferase [Gordonibacter sp.]|uniref:sugar transferase n=1 Tax=Gordonibacter sp. TaxID=1968902 RepID=UPI002FC7C343
MMSLQDNAAVMDGDSIAMPQDNDNIIDVDFGVAGDSDAAEKAMHGNLVYDMAEEESEGELPPDPEVYEAARRIDEERWFYRFAKRAFDIVFSLTVLVLFCWLFAIIAIAIKIDDPKGPVIFKQERVGKNGSRFMMWKFRSMYSDAESRLDELMMLNEKTGPVFKIARDPRITRVGRIIRKLSLDELPQFINCLGSRISIVGPRPSLPREVAQYSERQNQRLLVKPGITCYWQTRLDRDRITFDGWVDLDLLYIKQCGIFADFRQIVKTVFVVLTAQGN